MPTCFFKYIIKNKKNGPWGNSSFSSQRAGGVCLIDRSWQFERLQVDNRASKQSSAVVNKTAAAAAAAATVLLADVLRSKNHTSK